MISLHFTVPSHCTSQRFILYSMSSVFYSISFENFSFFFRFRNSILFSCSEISRIVFSNSIDSLIFFYLTFAFYNLIYFYSMASIFRIDNIFQLLLHFLLFILWNKSPHFLQSHQIFQFKYFFYSINLLSFGVKPLPIRYFGPIYSLQLSLGLNLRTVRHPRDSSCKPWGWWNPFLAFIIY